MHDRLARERTLPWKEIRGSASVSSANWTLKVDSRTVPIPAISLISAGGFDLESRSILWLYPIGRLKDGVTIDQARGQLQSFWPDVLLATASTQTPGLRRQTFLSMGLDVSPVEKGVSGSLNSAFQRPLYVLAGIVGLILLVAA